MKKYYLALVLSLYALAHATAFAVAPESRAEDWWKDRNEKFNQIAKEGKVAEKTVKVLFIGDSITQGWEGSGKKVWEKAMLPLNAVEFGIGGDRTENVIWRLDNGNMEGKLDPQVIVVMIGTNNTGHRKQAAEETAADIKTILEKLNKGYPQAQIILHAIFPRGEKPDNEHRKINDGVNTIISGYKLPNVHYLDINAKLMNADGSLDKKIMPDYLHLSEKGYQIWADTVIPEIKKYLKETE